MSVPEATGPEATGQKTPITRQTGKTVGPAPRLCKHCVSLLPPRDPTTALNRCSNCGSRALIAHPELLTLRFAHIDCDAFYAAVEKRDRPELRDRPVIIGGGTRGVVTTACYLARIKGVRSAMPMFQARALCPEAVVIKPAMEKYRAVGEEVRKRMRQLTPLVQPLSIDEAFLDFSATPGQTSPAQRLLALARNVASDLGITLSVGLSYNKLMAKIASDQDKPEGFFVIGRQDAEAFLTDQPVRILWGIGGAAERTLARRGIRTVGQLRAQSAERLQQWLGSQGQQLAAFARGEDARQVEDRAANRSLSSETTFVRNLQTAEELTEALLGCCETTGRRLIAAGLGGRTLTLKLKTSDFRLISRSQTIASPTCLAEVLFETCRVLLARETGQRSYRLMGVGVSDLCPLAEADPFDLADPDRAERKRLALIRAGLLERPHIPALEKLLARTPPSD